MNTPALAPSSCLWRDRLPGWENRWGQEIGDSGASWRICGHGVICAGDRMRGQSCAATTATGPTGVFEMREGDIGELLIVYANRLERFRRLLIARPDLVQAVGWLTEHGLPIPYVRPEWAIQVELAELVEGFGDGRDLQGFLEEHHTIKERGLPWPPKAS